MADDDAQNLTLGTQRLITMVAPEHLLVDSRLALCLEVAHTTSSPDTLLATEPEIADRRAFGYLREQER